MADGKGPRCVVCGELLEEWETGPMCEGCWELGEFRHSCAANAGWISCGVYVVALMCVVGVM